MKISYRLIADLVSFDLLLSVLPTLGLVFAIFVLPQAVEAQQWLFEANQRIEQYRKGDLTVRIVDPLGQVVEGAQVQVNMQRHAFGFGTAVTASWINRTSTDGDTFRAKLLENFNTVVFTNDLKWPAWEGMWGSSFNWPNTERALNWLNAQNLPTRGHHLSMATMIGADAWGTSPDEATLPARLFDHITEKATTVGDHISEWDVINHPVGWGTHGTYEDLFGIDFFKQIVDHSRSVVPEGMPLWINEDDITSGGRSADYQRIIQYLIDNGSAPDGIGIQGHINQNWGRIRTPEQVYSQLDSMANLIPRLKITEFDINTPGNDGYQAQLLHDYLVTFFSHPAVEEVLMWGFWGGMDSRSDDLALYRSDWTEKPALAAYQDLVFNQWWSEEEGETDQAGEFNARVFLGDYEVVVDYNGAQTIMPLNLDTDGQVLTVTVIAVPEPTALTLATLGLLGIACSGRKRV